MIGMVTLSDHPNMQMFAHLLTSTLYLICLSRDDVFESKLHRFTEVGTEFLTIEASVILQQFLATSPLTLEQDYIEASFIGILAAMLLLNVVNICVTCKANRREAKRQKKLQQLRETNYEFLIQQANVQRVLEM